MLTRENLANVPLGAFLVSDPCEPNPCLNDGLCIPAADLPGTSDSELVCACVPEFTGELCETPGIGLNI